MSTSTSESEFQYPSFEEILHLLPGGPRAPDIPTKIYTGGCHCGRFKFECRHPIVEDGFEVLRCNCSFCTRLGTLSIYIIDREKDFKLLQGSLDECHKYQFGRKMFTHLSCPDCAIVLFCDEPHNILAVSVRCLDGVNENIDKLKLKLWEGKNF